MEREFAPVQRQTWAAVLDAPISLFVPGFKGQVEQYHPFFDATRMTLRARIELARLEIDGITPKDRGEAMSLLRRAGNVLAREYLRRHSSIAGEPDDVLAGENALADVTLIRVDNYPAPDPHGLRPPDNSIPCPKCMGPMVARRNGARAFYGCKNYPACTGTRRITE